MISKELHLQRKRCRETKQRRNKLALKIIRILYKGLDESHKDMSKEYRKNFLEENNSSSLTYGEISPESFLQILDLVNPTQCPSKTFVDLGSGSGKAVLVAALSSHYFKKVAGIEIVPSLYESSIGVYSFLEQAILRVSTISHVPSHQQSDKSSKHDVLSTDTVFLNKIIEYLMTLPSGQSSCDIEILAQHLCTVLGHKKYKASLQSFKSLKKFLIKHADEFTVLNESEVCLNLNSTGTPLSDGKVLMNDTNFVESELLDENSTISLTRNIVDKVDEICNLLVVNTSSGRNIDLILSENLFFRSFPRTRGYIC